jgi:hypothetical protein
MACKCTVHFLWVMGPTGFSSAYSRRPIFYSTDKCSLRYDAENFIREVNFPVSNIKFTGMHKLIGTQFFENSPRTRIFQLNAITQIPRPQAARFFLNLYANSKHRINSFKSYKHNRERQSHRLQRQRTQTAQLEAKLQETKYIPGSKTPSRDQGM